jgi:hypothetical protein
VSQRTISLTPASTLMDDVPVWAWEHDGRGRIQLGTLSLFAGRPGAGKSSAARWFAAAYSRGTMPGCWHGKRQNVAYIAAEESDRFIVKPGLRAAGADMDRVYFPQVDVDGHHTRPLSKIDNDALTNAFIANNITVVVVDPLLSTIPGNVDLHRNNEVRAYLEPWAAMADAIGGVVIAVVHLTKSPNGDVVAAINGSSAFGEVARSVFGFAKEVDSQGDRVMSQAKNNAGTEDLALSYVIESTEITTDSGKTGEVGRFVITGNSDRTAGEVLQDETTGPSAEAKMWLADYLKDRRVRSSDAKREGRGAGFSQSSIERAAKKLHVRSEAEGFPRVTYWSLPDESRHQASEGEATNATEVTDATEDVDTSVRSVTSDTSTTSLLENGDATMSTTVTQEPLLGFAQTGAASAGADASNRSYSPLGAEGAAPAIPDRHGDLSHSSHPGPPKAEPKPTENRKDCCEVPGCSEPKFGWYGGISRCYEHAEDWKTEIEKRWTSPIREPTGG